MTIRGWIITFEACAYGFATPGCPTVVSYSDEDWSPAWTILDGGLDDESMPAWEERAHSNGEFQEGGASFVLHDDIAATGPAADEHVCTYTFTRAPALHPATRLTVSADASSGTLTVDSASALGLSWPNTIWVNREAVRIQSAAGNVLTVAASGRGYLGTYAVPHVVDEAARTFPKVWAAFPGLKKRRAILWAVSRAGAVTPWWRGVVGRGPALHESGAPFVVRCEGIWTLHKNLPLGDEFATTRFRGFNASALFGGVKPDATTSVQIGIEPNPNDRPTVSTLTEACRIAQADIRSRLATAGITSANPIIMPEGGGVVHRLDAAAGVSNAEVFLRVGTHTATGRTTESGGTRRAEARVEPVPQVLVATRPGMADTVLAITSAARLPTTWTSVPNLTTFGAIRTTITPVLRGILDEQTAVDVYVGSVATSGSFPHGSVGNTEAPYIIGSARLAPRDGRPVPWARFGRAVHYIDQDVALKLAARVVTDHWAAGFANAISDEARGTLRYLGSERDWDLSAAALAPVFAATGGPLAARELVLDGSFTVGEYIPEECALNGCALSLRGSRLTLAPIGPATSDATVFATITEGDLVEDERIAWEELDEEQVTTVEADVEGTTFVVHDDTARNSFGPGQTLSVRLRGRRQLLAAAADPQAFADALLTRVVGPYSEPVGCITVPLADLETFRTLAIGDYLDVAEWLAPDGAGGRGLGNAASLAELGQLSARVQVIGRRVDPAAHRMDVRCLVFPSSYGYAPACKVASSPSAKSVVVATSFITGATSGDYTDPDAGAADGGASRFPAPSVVKFVQMDTTSLVEYGPYTVASVSGTTIDFTGALDAALRTAIAAGTWFDIVSANFGAVGVTDDQKRYAYVGSRSAGVIDGTSTANRPWSP